VDITANLKGAVAKTHVQKILVALSDKGLLTQKVVGAYPLCSLAHPQAYISQGNPHSTLLPRLVYLILCSSALRRTWQGELEEVPKDQLAEMEAECKKLDGETKAIQLELKQLQSGKLQVHAHSIANLNHRAG
jgi:hypothetical protein